MEIKEIFDYVITLKFVPCHRRRDRSLHIKGKQLPVCTRCLFILLGLLFIPIFLITKTYLPIWLGIILNIPMVLDGYSQLKKWRTSNNFLRALTGGMSGMGLSMIAVTASYQLSQFIVNLI